MSVEGGSRLDPNPPPVLLLLETVEQKVVEELVDHLLEVSVVCEGAGGEQ